MRKNGVKILAAGITPQAVAQVLREAADAIETEMGGGPVYRNTSRSDSLIVIRPLRQDEETYYPMASQLP